MPTSTAQPAPRPKGPAIDIRDVIRRGQRRDRLFSYIGASFIFGSLAVLALLLGKLVVDGGPMLLHTQEVLESNGQAPRIVPVPDVVGKAKASTDPDGKPVWQIVPEPISIDTGRLWTKRDVAPKPEEITAFLASADGKRIVLESALITDPAGGRIEPEDMKLIAADDQAFAPDAKISRRNFVGTLRKASGLHAVGSGYEFVADPLLLDQSKMETKRDIADGKLYAVSPTRDLRKTVGTVVATDVEPMVSRSFILSMPASAWYRAGIHSAWVGSLLLMLVTVFTALPLGVAAGLYLEEYAPKNWFTGLIEINIANLAGVPSIVWGLLGLGLFVYLAHWGRSVLAAGLTLGLLVLPIIIIATREAIRAIPSTIRDASIALGATKWQTTWNHILPYSLGGIMTGSIVALSRAIGETAPLIVVGAVVFLTSLPPAPITHKTPVVEVQNADGTVATQPATGQEELVVQPFEWLNSSFTAMPIQMFEWTSRPEKEFQRNAAAAGIILIVMTLTLNSVAIWLRARLRKKIKW